MKLAIYLYTAVLSICPLLQAEPTANLKVHLKGLSSKGGVILLGLYHDETTWLEKPARGSKSDARGTESTVELKGLEPGTYAISVYQDINSDGVLNCTFFGMPKEPYAFSNNAAGTFGPASWEKVSFLLKEGDNEIRIDLD
ncbi:MAG: DUF2141 domain-containing protein [Opitutales bacterium]|nr:DUF2141 domain-containing protein [Opitutales bacterium]